MERIENIFEFDFEDVEVAEFNQTEIEKWLNEVLEKEQTANGVYIQFIFVTDDIIYDLNVKYLGHDTLTDIITFNYNDELENIGGDIFISYDRVIENAKLYDTTTRDELYRVMVHGVLHLLGYNDKDEAEKMQMRAKENYYLSLL